MELYRLRYWLFGEICCFCGRWHSGWWHSACPKMLKLAPRECVNQVVGKVREILADEPADRCVHEALDVINDLEKAFAKPGDR